MTIEQFIETLTRQAAMADSSRECHELSARLTEISKNIRDFNASIKTHGTDECVELDEYLEDLEAKAADAAKSCERWAEDMEEDEASERRYGSCNEQARSDYYASVL